MRFALGRPCKNGMSFVFDAEKDLLKNDASLHNYIVQVLQHFMNSLLVNSVQFYNVYI